MVVVLAPKDCEKLVSVYLPNPRAFPEIEQQLYYYDEDNLRIYEQVQYYDEYRSWFLGDRLQPRGEMVFMTRVDPLFIFVPMLIKFSSDKYRSLDDICSSYDEVIKNKHEDDTNKPRSTLHKIQESVVTPSSLRYALGPNIKWDLIAEIKEVDDEIYLKYCEEKTLNWLSCKFDKTMNVLASVMEEPGRAKPSKATLMSYACDLINVYVPPILSDKFKTKARIDMISANDTGVSEDERTTPIANGNSNGKRMVPSPSIKQISHKQHQQHHPAATRPTKSKATIGSGASNKADPRQNSILKFMTKKS